MSVAVGVVMLAISFFLPGSTRDTILRIAGGLAILAGAIMWVTGRRG